MKKLLGIISFILLLSTILGSYVYFKNNNLNAFDSTIILDFQKRNDSVVSSLLYDYILKDLKMSEKQAEDFARITPESVVAYKVDLNGDGADEIIGTCYSTFYWGTAGYSMIILRQQNGEYIDIAGLINFETQSPVYITNTKTNNYRDIVFKGSTAYNFKTLTAKYDGNNYVSKEEEELFLKYLKDFSDYDVSEITNEKE